LEQPLWTLSKHTFALPEKYRVPEIMDTTRWEFARAATVFAAGLGEREFIVGDTFSVADILIANTLNWARARNVDVQPTSLNAYADRMLARPALLRAHDRERAAA
jgi:glutathione S-transferase